MLEQAQPPTARKLESDHRSSAEGAGPQGSAAGRMLPRGQTLA